MSDPRTALLVGATGLVGGHCLKRLLAEDVYSSVLMRSVPKCGSVGSWESVPRCGTDLIIESGSNG